MSRSLIICLGCIVVVVLGMARRQKPDPRPYVYPEMKYFPEIPATKNVPSVEGVDLGRYLFYDPILSRDSSFSCASCHKQEFAFSGGPMQFDVGIDGEEMARNTMPLFNLMWNEAFFWDGRAGTIEEQALHPVKTHEEMNLSWIEAEERIKASAFYVSKFSTVFGEIPIDSFLIAKALGQFQRVLISSNSKFDQVLRRETYLTEDEYKGFELLNDQTKGNCLHCHTSDSDPLGTTGKFSNNGLDDFMEPFLFKDQGRGGHTGSIKDIGLFRIPSFRNVAVTGPYMHDGRFETLEQVIDFYNEGVNDCFNIDSKMRLNKHGTVRLNSLEKKQIISFLMTLTDTSFLNNPDFSNPF